MQSPSLLRHTTPRTQMQSGKHTDGYLETNPEARIDPNPNTAGFMHTDTCVGSGQTDLWRTAPPPQDLNGDRPPVYLSCLMHPLPAEDTLIIFVLQNDKSCLLGCNGDGLGVWRVVVRYKGDGGGQGIWGGGRGGGVNWHTKRFVCGDVAEMEQRSR